MEYSYSIQDFVSVFASVKIHLPSPTGEEPMLMSITPLITKCSSACVKDACDLFSALVQSEAEANVGILVTGQMEVPVRASQTDVGPVPPATPKDAELP